jgi:hypothetical protein
MVAPRPLSGLIELLSYAWESRPSHIRGRHPSRTANSIYERLKSRLAPNRDKQEEVLAAFIHAAIDSENDEPIRVLLSYTNSLMCLIGKTNGWEQRYPAQKLLCRSAKLKAQSPL